MTCRPTLNTSGDKEIGYRVTRGERDEMKLINRGAGWAGISALKVQRSVRENPWRGGGGGGGGAGRDGGSERWRKLWEEDSILQNRPIQHIYILRRNS